MNYINLFDAIMVAIIPIVFAFYTQELLKNKKAMTIINVLTPLAKDAVIAMQKLGVTTYLTGEIKRNKAINSVKESLNKLGFSNVDENMIANAIDKAYAQSVQELSRYPQMKNN